MPRKILYIAVFFSGMTTMAIEFATSRLLGNYFGSSNLVWAAIIGLILIYLTVGYFLGGYWADKSPYPQTFLKVIAWGGFTSGLVPVVARPILRIAANAFDQLQMGALVGSFLSTMIIFIIPVTLLGMASPFAVRLAMEDSKSAGSIAGRLYAISTIGSFMGTYLPVLVLIPLIGVYRTYIAFALVMVTIALLLMLITSGWKKAALHAWMLLVLIVLGVLGVSGFDKSSAGIIYEGDSAYNYIQVLEDDGYTLLRLNEGQGVHSIYHPEVTFYNGPWEQVVAAPFFNPAPHDIQSVQRVAIVGLAAGTTARQATAVFGEDVQIDGIEIDPEIVEVGRQYFDMNEPNLTPIIQDGRWALKTSPHQYQIISIDAYRPPYIPAHLTTQEFFQEVYNHLSPDGVMVINIGRGPNDRSLINAISSTVGTVFPSQYIMDLPNTFNTILYATASPTAFDNLKENYVALAQSPDTNPLLLKAIEVAWFNHQETPPSVGAVFTDDKAPIEWLTNNLILSFLFSDDMEMLQ